MTAFATDFQASAWPMLADQFGRAVTYTVNGAKTGVSITAIIHTSNLTIEHEDDGRIEIRRVPATIVGNATYGVAAPAVGDTVTWGGVTWFVEEIAEVAGQLFDLQLKHVGAVEKSYPTFRMKR